MNEDVGSDRLSTIVDEGVSEGLHLDGVRGIGEEEPIGADRSLIAVLGGGIDRPHQGIRAALASEDMDCLRAGL